MRKLSFIFVFLIITGISLSISSCEKVDVATATDKLFPENSEEMIDGELFVDGVSQKEVITDFELEDVRVIEGRLAFKDHDALIAAIKKIADYNSESVMAWSKKWALLPFIRNLYV